MNMKSVYIISMLPMLHINNTSPEADRIVQLTVNGGIIHMVYGDPQGARKVGEEELIVPLAAVMRVQLVQ